MIEEDIQRLQQHEPMDLLAGLEADVWLRLAVREERKRRSVQFTALQTLVLGVVFTIGALAGQHFSEQARRGDVLSVFSVSPPLSAANFIETAAR